MYESSLQILPFSGLGLAMVYISASVGPRLGAAKSVASPDEGSGLLGDAGASGPVDHPVVFWVLLLLALAPIIVIAAVAAQKDGDSDVCY